MKAVRSLLIVDDNQMDVILTRRLLERSGAFQYVDHVTDGAEALELFRNYEENRARHPERFPPMIILLDINMPRMNGFEFLAALSELEAAHSRTSVVVMLTSSSFGDDRQRALEYPVVKDYVVKPMNKAAVSSLIEKFGKSVEAASA